MDIWSEDKLLIFLAFVIPGFISLKVYSLLYPSAEEKSSDQLIDAIAYSCLNYAILAVPIFLAKTYHLSTEHPVLFALFILCTLFVAPIMWPFIWKNFRNTKLAKKHFHHPIAKPWDYVFSKGEHYWVIATLKDGRKIAGMYADKSFSSSSPAPEQLYLEEQWKVNSAGVLMRSYEGTAGVLILSPEISTVELTKMTYGDQNGRETPTQ